MHGLSWPLPSEEKSSCRHRNTCDGQMYDSLCVLQVLPAADDKGAGMWSWPQGPQQDQGNTTRSPVAFTPAGGATALNVGMWALLATCCGLVVAACCTFFLLWRRRRTKPAEGVEQATAATPTHFSTRPYSATADDHQEHQHHSMRLVRPCYAPADT